MKIVGGDYYDTAQSQAVQRGGATHGYLMMNIPSVPVKAFAFLALIVCVFSLIYVGMVSAGTGSSANVVGLIILFLDVLGAVCAAWILLTARPTSAPAHVRFSVIICWLAITANVVPIAYGLFEAANARELDNRA